MPRIRLVLEDVSEEQAERIKTELSQIAGCTVTMARESISDWIKTAPGPESDVMTPEQIAAAREMLLKLDARDAERRGWSPGQDPDDFLQMDAGPAIGEQLEDIDADETAEDIAERINNDVTRLCRMIGHLEAKVQAEGEHTAAANAEIERLRNQAVKDRAERNNP